MEKIVAILTALLFISCNDDTNGGDITFGGNGDVIAYSPEEVSKTNPLPVYAHYMPWFDAPMNGSGSWGIHWTMSTRNPEIIDENGQRQIAAHYYPLIGPYDSQDPDVVDYHLLLMKYSGIDGVLINWYGTQGTNGDIGLLLENSNAIIDRVDESGMEFAVVLEDRFAASKEDVKANVAYLGNNYYSHQQYIHQADRPMTLIFGPITINGASNWTEILNASPQDELFLPLWYHSGSAGTANTAGEYAWVYSDGVSGLRNFYNNADPELISGGGAYPGFNDYYEEGGWGNGYFNLEVGVEMLQSTLDVATEYSSDLDFLQLITWNDFGEGTIIEPTVEFGFSFLETVQDFTGVNYDVEELQLIHEHYQLRKNPEFTDNEEIQNKLDQVFYYLVALRVDDARELMKEIN